MIKKIIHQFEYEVFENESELNHSDSNLLFHAKKATETAYAPYSQFFVGAAVLLSSGEIITGSNQENAAFPSGLCAERTALFTVGHLGKSTEIQAIAITATTQIVNLTSPVFPCGACRQVMLEFENLAKKPIKVIMKGMTGEIIVVNGIKDNLLPFVFEFPK